MKKRLDNRGSSLIIVIIVIAFVSLLVSTLFMMSVINIEMKSVDREAKENFYSAEGALEQITMGLQKELSDVSSEAYLMMMNQYAGSTMEVQRKRLFNTSVLTNLKTKLQGDEANGIYDRDVLYSYLSDDIKPYVTLDSVEWKLLPETLLPESESLVLKKLEVTFTDASGYQSVIETDIRITAPNLNPVQPAEMQDVFDYSIIANEQLVATMPGNVTIEAGVYAGEGGLQLASGSRWNFQNAKYLVVKGDVNIPRMASISTTTDMDLWAKELNIKGGELAFKGRTYVADDMTLSDQGSRVMLDGEYYGYGNGEALTVDGEVLSTGAESSAILINGTQSSLDMSNVRRLLLSGSAQIATGKEEFDFDNMEDLLPENDASLNTQLEKATLGAGTYYIQSRANELLVCSKDNYLLAETDPGYTVVSGSWELMSLIYNADGTYSLMDQNSPNKNKFVSVQTDDQNKLVANADSIGVNEKFHLYVHTENNVNYYALKAYANGKFVSIDTYYPEGGDEVQNVLCANRDKVTDSAQLFKVYHYGSLPMVEEETVYEPTVAITFDAANQISVEMGYIKWGMTIPRTESARISYTVRRNGRVVAGSTDRYYRMNGTAVDDNSPYRRLYYNIFDLQVGDVIAYQIRYSDEEKAGGWGTVSGTYTHRPGYGNTPSDELKMVDGIYWLRSAAYTTDAYIQRDSENILKCVTNDPKESDGSWEEFILVNNHDGTISLKCIVADKYYLSVQADGSVQTTSREIGVNEKFVLKAVGGDDDYYRLQTLEDSLGQGGYLYINRYKAINTSLDNNWICVAKDSGVSYSNRNKSYLILDWLRITDETGTVAEDEEAQLPANYNPVTKMEYSTETTAEVSFTTAHWSSGNTGTATLYYEINGSPTYTPINMSVSGAQATCQVQNLQNGDKVTYRFVYTNPGSAGIITTSTYVYVHETIYGEAIYMDGENTNINLGESIEVKSNQIAYLVPPECIGVYEGETVVGKNPLTTAEFTRLMSYANNTVKYPDFEMVSFTKEVKGLGKSLESYRTPGTDGYRTVFVQTSKGTMVYFYVSFDPDKTQEYFRDYYEKNQSMLESYMSNYVNEIKLSNRFTKLTTDGNMVYSSTANAGRIDLQAGSVMNNAQLSSLRNEEEGYLKRFRALTTKLMLDYDEVAERERKRNVFDNLIRYSTVEGDSEAQAFPYTGTTPQGYTADGATALMVNNAGLGAYVYDEEADPDGSVCLIIATGDVVLKQDFSGIILARGTITVAEGVSRISTNRRGLHKVLRYEMPNGEQLVQYYFRDASRYILENMEEEVVEPEDYISYADLVTYEEWTKR